MSLNDRLNKALAEKQLRPTVVINKSPTILATTSNTITQTSVYPTLEAVIEAADSIEPDEFGTRVVIVEKITRLNQTLLPMIMGKYIVDDIQKKIGGGYEVHLLLLNKDF